MRTAAGQWRALTVVVVVALTALGLSTDGAKAVDGREFDGTRMVALGDSVAAGFQESIDNDACGRNASRAYSAKLREGIGQLADLLNAACTGAKVSDVIDNQVQYVKQHPPFLTTLTIGANDTDWVVLLLMEKFGNCSSIGSLAWLTDEQRETIHDGVYEILKGVEPYSYYTLVSGYYNPYDVEVVVEKAHWEDHGYWKWKGKGKKRHKVWVPIWVWIPDRYGPNPCWEPAQTFTGDLNYQIQRAVEDYNRDSNSDWVRYVDIQGMCYPDASSRCIQWGGGLFKHPNDAGVAWIAERFLAKYNEAFRDDRIWENLWYSVVPKSRQCVDARGGATANGTVVWQYSCNNTYAQHFGFEPTSDGYFRVNNRNDPSKVWDITGVSSADGARVQLWQFVGGHNQQWLPVYEGNGYYHFVARHSGKCLDVPGASTIAGVQLQQWPCNGTSAQSFAVAPHWAGAPG